jgi:predicted secreted protein
MAGTEGGMGLQVKITVGTQLTAITYLLEGSELPKFKAFIAEATPHNATGGWTKRVHSGKRSLESFKVVLGWDSDETTHAALQTAFDSDAAVAMNVISPDGSDETIAFSAFIEEIARMTSQEDKYTAEVMISPTGKPTIT